MFPNTGTGNSNLRRSSTPPSPISWKALVVVTGVVAKLSDFVHTHHPWDFCQKQIIYLTLVLQFASNFN
jgi:hypothetical protein